MSKKMLINALHAEEARVAIVEDGRLVDLDVEIAGNEQIRGNIYRGVVVRVEPGLQAAFVDIGLKKLGFLQMGEIHPENYRWRDDIPEEQRHRRPRIQEVLRRGQELLVQVEKGERDNKGSALTTYVSLPGRYMVLMPGSDSAGISRKVEAEGERKKLKEIISEMSIPEGYGYIIRTEAVGRTREELQKDLDSLINLYEGVKAQGATMKGAGLIYQESALIIRTIRDYFSSDIDEVLVDSKDVFRDVRECLKEIDPQFEKLVKMHQEKRPIFSRYQLEEQIDLIYEKKVPLKSGGSIFIEPTEALVSIDVNSGKSTGEKGVEDTAFKTNLEAAEEAARQLRLRDLGGLIVIDFIDMRERKHNAEVEKALKSALKADKARVNVSRISEFGLLEMSRQRIRQTLNQASTLECPHCDGRGKVKSVEAMALSFLRKVHAAAAKGTISDVVGSLPLEVAYYLLNRKRHELSQIENDYDIQVTVKGKPSYLLNQMDLELFKREKHPQEELPQEKPLTRATVKEEAPAAPQEAAPAEAGKKKRKRKGKAHPEAAAAAPEAAGPEPAPALPAEAGAHEAPPAPAAAAEAGPEGVPIALVVEPGGAERVLVEGEHEEPKKKRRRKRRRGKGAAAEAAGEHGEPAEVAIDLPAEAGAPPEEAAALETHPVEHPAEHPEGGEHPAEEVKKKRRRRRRRGKGGHEAPEAALEAIPAVAMGVGAAGEIGGEAAGAEGVMPPERPTQLEALSPEPSAEVVEGAPEAAPAVEEKPKKTRRSRKKRPAEAAEAPVEAPAALAQEGPASAETAAESVTVATEAPGEAAPAEAAVEAEAATAAAPVEAEAVTPELVAGAAETTIEAEAAPVEAPAETVLAQPEEAAAEAAVEAEPVPVETAPEAVPVAGEGGEPGKRPRPRRKRPAKKEAAGEVTQAVEVAEAVPVADALEVSNAPEVAASAAGPEAEAPKAARGRGRSRKAPKEVVVEPAEAPAAVEPPPAPAGEKKKRAPRKPAGGEAEPAPLPEGAGKPARQRSPRKKKEETPV